ALQVVDRNDASNVELGFECIVDTTVESLNAQGETVSVMEERSRRYPLEDSMYDEVIERGGQPLAANETHKERKRKQRFIQNARKQKERGSGKRRDRRQVRFGRELMQRYRVSLGGVESVRGRGCWVLSYQPRSGDLPRSGPMDGALNRSLGRLWLAQSDYALVRLTFRLQSPIRYVWGILATLNAANGEVDFDPVTPGVWLPSRFHLDLDLKLLGGLKSIRRRIQSQWSGYRPVAANPSAM
ncbi:MAG: hypothetical protein OXD30_04525, partial [Bryobacterales bacterium]|nr:hypothetical protein [Bryobacterales bacterium]